MISLNTKISLTSFKQLIFSFVFFTSTLGFTLDYSCKTKSGKSLDIITLMESGGLDITNSMKNSVGERLYTEYMKFADKAEQKFPLFGLALKKINLYRWFPLYQFNCTKVEGQNTQESNPVNGLEKAIIYSKGETGSQFYVVKKLEDKSFDSSPKSEFKDKTRILALINEALRNFTGNTEESLKLSRMSNLFYELVNENLDKNEFIKKQSQINNLIEDSGSQTLLTYTRSEFISLRELMPQLTNVLESFQGKRQIVLDQIISACNSIIPIFSGLKVDMRDVYLEYEKNRNSEQIGVNCRFKNLFGKVEYDSTLIKYPQFIEIVNSLWENIDAIYDNFLPPYFAKKGRSSLTGVSYYVGTVGANRYRIYKTISDPKFEQDIFKINPNLEWIYLWEYGFNEKLKDFRKSSTRMQDEIDQLLSGKEIETNYKIIH